MKTVAIIPAGGAGKRLKSHVAKQFLLLDGLPVLVHTLKVFQKSKDIDDIILALPPDELVSVRQDVIEKYGLTKTKTVVAGGGERQDSVKNCLAAVQGECDLVVIHDAVRPFVTEELIRRVVDAARVTGAASAGVKAKDTIKETGEDRMVLSTVPRHNLWQTQTPQAFKFELLKDAYKAAYDEKFYGTDDASLVERRGGRVEMIEGSSANIKITTKEDMLIADALMKKDIKISLRNGFGYDSHRFAEDRKLILGGVEIPFEKGLYGHSDADALIHAICDAMLGAAGAGDIGRHFPDTDPEYKNISSMILLEKVKKIIEAKGFFINNLDATVVMEMPKLAPYAAQMISNVAGVLNIAETSVNIKAKTNEGMGFTGKNEGVAVFAIATVTERKSDGSRV
ncbi:MAG: bifunctional 2-C-methyl-D-erythritol 4-phosphate cytidylyltransferase/2-C-methyl-D-erythritol 2,4-cyclodiphosphate synthase [Deltaproteobacteria bacterium HGW-Deltaproteobacteria-7]|jgi:2-C-methyl-D-erythritol 4-phosphate cytidylyltransferase/2-C-methyl-D-erythritol 2,4-cyclodiphosphate synthase|nr:MAG: bifunctional 2-C-methyl-D-erythritol 4-phosphate cytidylyltransferase/2-C-methyl-D-erythritol 2,4-cyclodiphosphate synthase [Deltaproteobacteria bacterium HGW-Deltaproteobacteria-7]PKN52168.1 MAG: bifunctional 2-C-methyl-D-erythritol 4-phosphate cytidylyltransferase/2-C-methyl-D-erythritol 2,4-cyclodiphosphate synthase [Deltaproteobacteria bacterium HGW-Deltaproteobacteria-13]